MGVTQLPGFENGIGVIPITRRAASPIQPAEPRQAAVHPGTSASPANQLRGWITVLLGGATDATSTAPDEEHYLDAGGQPCLEELPPVLRVTNRLARFERQRRAAVACERRLEEEAPQGRAQRIHRAQCEHQLKVAHESRMRLRDEAWALGGHYYQHGVDAARVAVTVAEAVGRMLDLVAVSDRTVESALAHDLVRWGQQGYQAAAARA
jgi:hypothetical protein